MEEIEESISRMKEPSEEESAGVIIHVAGPVVEAENLRGVEMYEVVEVGEEGLIGEVIELEEDVATIQVYEETGGIKPGEPVRRTGEPLSLELGPGLIEQIYDGIQRPLESIVEETGDFIRRGVEVAPLDEEKEWGFVPRVEEGDEVEHGDILGVVEETKTVDHKVMVPPNKEGTVKEIVSEGEYTIDETIAVLESENGEEEIRMKQRWPVRVGRPTKDKKQPGDLLVTGQRVLDTFFPLAKGGTAAIPGGFGTGKCVTGDTSVLLADGTKLPIKELYEKYEYEGEKEVNEHEELVKLDNPLNVLSMDDGKIVQKEATCLYKGKTDSTVVVNTRSGREVELTPVHKLYVLDSEGKIIERPAEELQKEDTLLAPKEEIIDEKINDGSNINQLEKNPKTEVHHFLPDPVKSVELKEETKNVYDLTVPGTHNFVGGDPPMILHNTVIQHQLAKWSDADIVVYVGCGERGNEMTEVLRDFPELEDPWSGEPLMKRTVLIANTSNMPVAAREASVFSGITIAEYYRDMGYNVALMADSTSRWAEALREISGRLEEMPGEEGFPAYLASELASFYERAGICELYGGREGSISVIGAVSPSGGDFSEPVTQNTLRIVQVFWALDTELKNRRHFPAIDWLTSYSLYLDEVSHWWEENVSEHWKALRRETMRLLEKESELEEIVQLVGPDALPPSDQFALQAARMVREDFLQQNAFHEVDTFCEPEKQFRMLRMIMSFYETGLEALDKGVSIDELASMDVLETISRMSNYPSEEWEKRFNDIEMEMNEEFNEMEDSLELSSPIDEDMTKEEG